MDNASASDGFKVIVFTCGDLGIEVANRVVQLEGIAAVAVVQAPWRYPPVYMSTMAPGGMVPCSVSQSCRSSVVNR